jgi:hypothetical protein
MFFGVPFHGAEVAAVASMYASVHDFWGPEWYRSLLDLMRPDSDILRRLRDDLRAFETQLEPKINIHCIFEVEETDFGRLLGVQWRRDIVQKFAKKVLPKVCHKPPSLDLADFL